MARDEIRSLALPPNFCLYFVEILHLVFLQPYVMWGAVGLCLQCEPAQLCKRRSRLWFRSRLLCTKVKAKTKHPQQNRELAFLTTPLFSPSCPGCIEMPPCPPYSEGLINGDSFEFCVVPDFQLMALIIQLARDLGK